MRKLVLYVRQARAEAHMQLYIQVWIQAVYRGVDGWMRRHNDIQAIYYGIVWYRILQVAGHFGPPGPPRVLRTARITSGG
jgi:hypothetical protein